MQAIDAKNKLLEADFFRRRTKFTICAASRPRSQWSCAGMQHPDPPFSSWRGSHRIQRRCASRPSTCRSTSYATGNVSSSIFPFIPA